MVRNLLRRNGFYPGCIDAWSPEHVISTRASSKRANYKKAYDSLEIDPIKHKDSVVKVMVKNEKHPVDKIKPPRLIQYRNTRYVAKAMQYMAPIETKLYQMEFNGYPVFAKHMNYHQRGEAIAAMGGPDYCYVMLDHKAFDGHISVDHLEFEHAIYNWAVKDPDFAELLTWQLKNRCFSRCGYNWRVEGGRMSGDPNTSLGNNMINLAVLLLWAKHIGCYKYIRMLLDGDDCVLALPRRFMSDLQLDFFTRFGFEMTLEATGNCPEEVIFCQTRPIFDGKTWCMSRNYERAGSKLQYTTHQQRGVGWLRYARGIALSERNLGDGMPIFSAIGKRLCELIPDVRPLLDPSSEYKRFNERPYADREVTLESRVSFSYAWGISCHMQELIENHIASARVADPLFSIFDPKSLSHDGKVKAKPPTRRRPETRA